LLHQRRQHFIGAEVSPAGLEGQSHENQLAAVAPDASERATRQRPVTADRVLDDDHQAPIVSPEAVTEGPAQAD